MYSEFWWTLTSYDKFWRFDKFWRALRDFYNSKIETNLDILDELWQIWTNWTRKKLSLSSFKFNPQDHWRKQIFSQSLCWMVDSLSNRTRWTLGCYIINYASFEQQDIDWVCCFSPHVLIPWVNCRHRALHPVLPDLTHFTSK